MHQPKCICGLELPGFLLVDRVALLLLCSWFGASLPHCSCHGRVYNAICVCLCVCVVYEEERQRDI